MLFWSPLLGPWALIYWVVMWGSLLGTWVVTCLKLSCSEARGSWSKQESGQFFRYTRFF
jgi:hypothetical protein